jgi:hypothetical protein
MKKACEVASYVLMLFALIGGLAGDDALFWGALIISNLYRMEAKLHQD